MNHVRVQFHLRVNLQFFQLIHWRDYLCPHIALAKTYLAVFVQVDFLNIDSVPLFYLFLCQYAAVLNTLTFYYIFKQNCQQVYKEYSTSVITRKQIKNTVSFITHSPTGSSFEYLVPKWDYLGGWGNTWDRAERRESQGMRSHSLMSVCYDVYSCCPP